ncbi:MAG: hypothetical protein J6O88_10210 [Chryseobacterium sp.]|uniref:hypothetical protein n=1 Tax=Chryseobacterium sp. TaxID=1871047 RepID=UPI001B129440|nr:hypothetical protein [Chryseobacterium sp.]MBO6185040.1 hypothetical protein [Chryseobacterium sp.]
MKYLYLLFFALIISCKHSTQTNNGKDFIGLWKTNDSLNIRLEIKQKTHENKIIEDRYTVTISEPQQLQREREIINKQFNYKFVESEEYNIFPFKEFLYENTTLNTNFIGFKNQDTLIRTYPDFDNQIFIRVK